MLILFSAKFPYPYLGTYSSSVQSRHTSLISVLLTTIQPCGTFLMLYIYNIVALSETSFPAMSQQEKVAREYRFFWISKNESEHFQSSVSFAIKTEFTKSFLSLPEEVNDWCSIVRWIDKLLKKPAVRRKESWQSSTFLPVGSV